MVASVERGGTWTGQVADVRVRRVIRSHHPSCRTVQCDRWKRKTKATVYAFGSQRRAHTQKCTQPDERKEEKGKARSFILAFFLLGFPHTSYRITVFTQGVDLPRKLRCTPWTGAFFCNFMHNQKRFFLSISFWVSCPTIPNTNIWRENPFFSSNI